MEVPARPADALTRVHARLNQLRGRVAASTVLRAVVLGVAMAASVGVPVLAAEALLWMPPLVRLVLLATVAALGLAPLVRAAVDLGLALTGRSDALSDAALARLVGTRAAGDGERLLSFVELDRTGTGGLAAVARDRLGLALEPVRFDRSVSRTASADALARWACVPLGLLVVWAAASPGTLRPAADRMLAPASVFARPAPFTLDVQPGDARLASGDTLAVAVTAVGGRPADVWLESRRTDETAVERARMLPSGEASFAGALPGVRHEVQYRIVADPVASPWYDVAVSNPPTIRGFRVELVPPRYSGLAPSALPPGVGDVTALPGTQVRVSASLGGGGARSARLAFDAAPEVPLELSGGAASGSFRVTQADAYRLVVESATDAPAAPGAPFYVTLLADTPPDVRLDAPEADVDLDESRRVTLRAEASDDFGLSDARLVYRLEQRAGQPAEAEEQSTALALMPGERVQPIRYTWDLSDLPGLTLAPGDVIAYRIEVRDNNAVRGAQTGRSQTHRVRLPGLDERYDALDRSEDELERGVERLNERSDEAREQFEELRRELRQSRDAGWQSQQALESIEQRRRQIDEQSEQLTQAADELGRQMEEQGVMSEQMREQYRELRRVMEEMAAPELQQALEELRRAMEELDLSQMQQAMEQYERSEQQQRQRLERALELMRNLRIQRELEELGERAAEIADEQEAIRDDTRRLDESDNTGTNDQGDEAETSSSDEAQGESSETEAQSEGESSESEAQREQAESGEQQDASQGEQSSQPPGDAGEQSGQDEPSGEAPSQEELDALAERQERAAERADSLNAQLDRLRERMEEARSADERRLDQLRQQTQTQATPEQMRQTAQQMQQGQTGQQQQSQQQQSEQQLRRLQQGMMQMQQQMQQQQDQINIAALRRALDDVLLLSDRQEALRRDVGRVSGDSPVLRASARDQTRLRESFETVVDSLTALARRAPRVTRAVQRLSGEALREMDGAQSELADRRPSPAAARQRAAMTQLNELALRLSRLLDEAMSQASSQGGQGQSMQQMMQQLQQMSGQQQQLNQQIQEHLNQTAGERLQGAAGERMRQIAEQQARIRRQLREMARGLDEGSAEGQMLRQLEQAAQQMAETVDELSRGRAGGELIERQQQILTRLLQAQNASQQRGEEERREGRTAEDQPRPPGTPAPPEEQAEQLRRDLIRALEGGYAPDYQSLIRRYFELLRTDE